MCQCLAPDMEFLLNYERVRSLCGEGAGWTVGLRLRWQYVRMPSHQSANGNAIGEVEWGWSPFPMRRHCVFRMFVRNLHHVSVTFGV